MFFLTKKNNSRRGFRRSSPLTPPDEKQPKPYSLSPLVSCGKQERHFLKYLLSLGANRCNISDAGRSLGISRNRVYQIVQSLKLKGFVEKVAYGHSAVITEAGKHFLEVQGYNRTVCKGGDAVSYVRDHKFTFQISIKKYPTSWKTAQVAKITNEYVQKTIHNFSKNNPLINANLAQEVDITITTTKAIIRPKHIFEQDHADASSVAITKAMSAIEFLHKEGFILTDSDGVMRLIQTEGHYAEVNSLLAQFFEKHVKGFCVFDENKKPAFWVDHSNGHLEDETADEPMRENLNKHMFDLMHYDKYTLSQTNMRIDEIEKALSHVAKIELLRHPPTPENERFDGCDYFG